MERSRLGCGSPSAGAPRDTAEGGCAPRVLSEPRSDGYCADILIGLLFERAIHAIHE
jgi:hypothetical protein